jgi:hypothetical protein
VSKNLLVALSPSSARHKHRWINRVVTEAFFRDGGFWESKNTEELTNARCRKVYVHVSSRHGMEDERLIVTFFGQRETDIMNIVGSKGGIRKAMDDKEG